MLKNLKTRWIAANFAGLAIGGLLHPFIAHGLTGAHGFWLTLPQFLMHTIGFLTFGLCIASAQRWALNPFARRGWGGVWLKAALFVAAYWAGYYTGGTPFNTVAGFTVLGIVTGLELRGAMPNWKRWTAASAAGFAAASVAAILVLAPTHKKIQAAFADDMTGVVFIWLIIGSVGGLAAGLLTAGALSKALQSTSESVPDVEIACNLRRAS
jgi:hypothetical protein